MRSATPRWLHRYASALACLVVFLIAAGALVKSYFGLPAGEYVLEAWHETLGTQTQSVSVAEDGAAEVAFDFAPAAG